MSKQKLTGGQLKKFRSEIAKLKKAGIVSDRVDARSQKPTRHMLAKVKKFQYVLDGRADLVRAKTTKEARRYADAFDVSGKTIAIKTKKPTRKRRLTKAGISFVDENGRRRIIPPSGEFRDVKGYSWAITMNWNFSDSTVIFPTLQELENFMNTDSKRNFKTWRKYAFLISTRDAEDMDDE
jgi:hypothetical protein